MKRILCILLTCLLFFSLSVGASAEEETTEDTTEDTADAPMRVDEAAQQYLEELEALLPEGVMLPLGDAEAMGETVGVHGLFSAIGAYLSLEREDIVRFAASLLGMTLLLMMLRALSDGQASVAGGALQATLSVLLLEQLLDTVHAVAEGIGAASSFFSSLIPLLAAVTAAGGAEGTAAATSLGMTVTVDVLNTLLSELLLPLGGLLFALGLIGMLGEGGGARVLGEQLKQLFTWGLGLLSTLLGAAVSLQTVLASAADSAALRAARYTLSGMLPAVGGAVAGTLSTVVGGLSYVRSTVGVGVIFVLLLLLVPPLVRLLLYRFLLRTAGAMLRHTGEGAGAPDALCTALDIYVALLSIAGVLMILEVVLFIRLGASLAG